MFSRFVTLLAIVALVVAAPQTTPNTPQTGSNAGSNASNSGSASQCATSSQYCCNQGFSVRHLFHPPFPGQLTNVFIRRIPPHSAATLAASLTPFLGLLYRPDSPAPPLATSVSVVLETAASSLRAALSPQGWVRTMVDYQSVLIAWYLSFSFPLLDTGQCRLLYLCLKLILVFMFLRFLPFC